jgi:hypothetical protein
MWTYYLVDAFEVSAQTYWFVARMPAFFHTKFGSHLVNRIHIQKMNVEAVEVCRQIWFR